MLISLFTRLPSHRLQKSKRLQTWSVFFLDRHVENSVILGSGFWTDRLIFPISVSRLWIPPPNKEFSLILQTTVNLENCSRPKKNKKQINKQKLIFYLKCSARTLKCVGGLELYKRGDPLLFRNLLWWSPVSWWACMTTPVCCPRMEAYPVCWRTRTPRPESARRSRCHTPSLACSSQTWWWVSPL